ncbi:putative NADP-dependent oxidoreductase YfmJ [Marivirga tractuosa]|uniref:Alcohol dehydrogenase zinc-binding domain protein n=1 Tax=Marivirga tractuosa (strain ATCC 23168 / DSM 4126 / NBRC 15989 / NCIMB 1408 / VKM B-1430 / H-43) TaxID=643867 RepID=E4TLL8_MARTH|nr:NADP-dependent oxidoreductase [Marivirga tractuosa]ADR22322.1 Alcohol dehydrogenase zinc-binding domain protein [Marivirga tractuosa DSM 4126]BDD13211.1 putative NADP-dependent oxidoreductase YfmJ [Marivirga tractuosa]
MSTNNTINLKNRPKGRPSLDDFDITTSEIPEVQEGELLLGAKYVSVDPYLRGRMSDAPSYVPPFELNKPIKSGVVAEVLESKNDAFAKGEFVVGELAWKEQQVVKGDGLMKVDPDQAALSAYLGVLGMTGLTAYHGLMEIGRPVKGETLIVSGAAGAVGSIVGQIGKTLGMQVVGIAGSDEKVEMLKSQFGFDEVINYKTTENMTEAIAEACPNGVDVYFDNVGGEISDAVLFNINKFSRTINCGAISVYNNTEAPKSMSVQPFLVKKSSLMQGFIVTDYADKNKEAIQQLSEWLQQEKLHYTETIKEGFKQIPQAFLDLFEGKNKGKMIVKL